MGPHRPGQRQLARHYHPAYRGDLGVFAEHYDGDLAVMGVEPVRAFLSGIASQSSATRKRKRAAVSAFCRWASGMTG